MKRFALALTFLLFALPLVAQTPPAPAPSQSPFKNVEVLKSLTPAQLSSAMQMISASLGTNCGFCHVRKGEELDFAADDKPEKQTARHMMRMTMDLNSKYFENHVEVSCNSCHRGSTRPVSLVALPRVVPPPPPAPAAGAAAGAPAAEEKRPPAPKRDEIVAKYDAAIGNPSPAALSSLIMKGTRETANGMKSDFVVEQRDGMTRVQSGEMVSVVTPNGGWTTEKGETHALSAPMYERSSDFAAAQRFVLPQDIPADARVSGRKDKVGDREAYVVSSAVRPGVRQRLYFDAENGLLLRRVLYTSTPIGEIPMQVDYSDYREAGGVKLPFTVHIEAIDPRSSSTRHYAEIHTGAKVDESVFAMPR